MISLSLLKRKQLSVIENKYKLEDIHLKRLLPYMGNIFGESCCLWNSKECITKDCYVVVNIHSQHYALHRILYLNYIDNKLKRGRYLGRTCGNNLCMCLKHFVQKNSTTPKVDTPINTNVDLNVSFD